MTWEKFLKNPIRIKTLPVTDRKRCVTIACAGNTIIDLETHSSNETVLDIYRRVESLKRPSAVTWLSTTLNKGENISEVVIRSLWDIDHASLMECGLIVSYDTTLSFRADLNRY